MNSLSDLNNWSNTGFEFTDDRPTTYTFDPAVPVNQSAEAYENQSFGAPAGTDIVAIINRVQDLTFNVNVSALPGTTVVWTGLTGNLIQSNVGGVYSVTGIRSPVDWEIIKNPTITMPTGASNWQYTSNIVYHNGNVAWDTSVSVIQLDQLTAASDYYYPDGVSNLITGTPQVFDLGFLLPPNFTCNITSSDNSVFGNLTASGGTFTSNVLALSGNLATINTQLSNIYYWPLDGIETEWLATYNLYNSYTVFNTIRTQTIRSQTAAYLDASSAFYYDRNISNQSVTGHPTVVDIISNTAATYTMVISSLDNNMFGNLATNHGFGTSVFSANVLTITGNKATVNSHLDTLTYTPALDYESNTNFRYELTVPGGNVSVRLQDALISANNTIISNISISRSYVSNTQDQQVFPTSIPQIAEEVPGATYTIYLSTAAGKFGTTLGGAGADSNFSYTGTKSQVNNIFDNIYFYPNKDVIGSQTFTYVQVRNGITQLTQVVSYVGTARTPVTTYQRMVGTHQFYVPTYEEANYLRVDFLIVGGGAGGYNTGSNGVGGGGGGGGFQYLPNQTLTTSIEITPGAGGTFGNNGGNTRVTYSGWSSGGGTYRESPGGRSIGALNKAGPSYIMSASTHYPPNTVSTIRTGGDNWGGGSSALGGGASSVANGQDAQGSTEGGNGAAGYLFDGTYFGGGGAGWYNQIVSPKTSTYKLPNGGNTTIYTPSNGTGVSYTGAGGRGGTSPQNGQTGVVVMRFHT
jgi:hypothetical protein